MLVFHVMLSLSKKPYCYSNQALWYLRSLGFEAHGLRFTLRLHSSSFLGLIFRIL